MFCKECGTENPEGASLCKSCGKSLSTSQLEGISAKMESLPIQKLLLYGAAAALALGLLAGITFDDGELGGGTLSSIFQWLMWALLVAGVLGGLSVIVASFHKD